MEFIYTDSIELNESLALDLFPLADKYFISALKTLCEQYLSAHLSPENYVAVANLAETLEVKSLRESAIAYIVKNVKVLKNRKDFEGISDDLLRDVIVKVTAR